MTINVINNEERRGPGLWKFNSNLLTNHEYTQKVTELIQSLKTEHNTMNAHQKWEFIKYKIREYSIRFAKQQARSRRFKQKELYNKLTTIEQQIDQNNDSNEVEHLLNKLNMTRKELEHLEKIEAYGRYIRSKAFFLEHDQKNSAIFLSLEKKNYDNKNIRRLIDSKGRPITKPKEILQETANFYKSLYDTDNNVSDDFYEEFFKPDKIPQIDDNSRVSLNQPLTEPELKKSIHIMKCNKTPGTDGLTKEFYAFFWNQIKECLIESYNLSFKEGHLSFEQRRGVIRLLPKKDKDTSSLKNWRPISLLNVNTKILTNCLAQRLQKVLPSIIHNDQNGFLKNRFIGTNIRAIIDSIDYLNREKKEALLAFIDFENAF